MCNIYSGRLHNLTPNHVWPAGTGYLPYFILDVYISFGWPGCLLLGLELKPGTAP